MIVAIAGLGQIGSSLGAALVARRTDARVIGIVRRWDAARDAVLRRAAHEVTTDLQAVRAADVVVLAAPVGVIVEQIPEVARLMKPGALLTDVGSTKSDILRAARALRTRRFSFIGGHPMAGREKSGLAACDPELFRDRPWILVKGFTAQPHHAEWMEHFVSSVGARPVWMKDGDRHDRLLARLSHLPHLLAYALLDGMADDGLSFAGGSFRGATRVAASPASMVLDFLLTNRRHVPDAVRDLVRELQRLSSAVKRGDRPALARAIAKAQRRRAALGE